MLIHVVTSKIHRIAITATELFYEGSLSLDEDLIEQAGLVPYERIQILNTNNGERLETYVIKAERGSGEVCLNGPAARRGSTGDEIIVVAYCLLTPEEAEAHTPTIIYPGR